MPIHPDQKDRYPKNWKAISERMRKLAGWKCEGSPDYPECNAREGTVIPGNPNGSLVVLTVAHLDHTPENVDPTNLRVWCQRCHLNYDAPHHRKERARRKREAAEADGQQTLVGDAPHTMAIDDPIGSFDVGQTPPPGIECDLFQWMEGEGSVRYVLDPCRSQVPIPHAIRVPSGHPTDLARCSFPAGHGGGHADLQLKLHWPRGYREEVIAE